MSDKEERIRQRAYEKWQKEGESHGWHDRHWAEAEREISDEESSKGSAKKAGSRKKAPAAGKAADTTPMMDDAGMPDNTMIKSDGGATPSDLSSGSDAKPRAGAAKAKASATKSTATKTAATKSDKPVATKPAASGKPATTRKTTAKA